MKTWVYFGATMPEDYGPGFVQMTQYCGYTNFSYANDWFVTGDDYWTVVSDINSGWPLGLCIGSEFHWRAIKGYVYDGIHWIICTNSATMDDYEWKNWDALGLFLFTSCIKN